MPDPEPQSSTPANPSSSTETQPAQVETPIPVVKLDPGYLEHGQSQDGIETRD